MEDAHPLIAPLVRYTSFIPTAATPPSAPEDVVLTGIGSTLRPLWWKFLETLCVISGLPDAIGEHACECGHPEIQRLPDGVYRSPACRSKVLLISPP